LTSTHLIMYTEVNERFRVLDKILFIIKYQENTIYIQVVYINIFYNWKPCYL